MPPYKSLEVNDVKYLVEEENGTKTLVIRKNDGWLRLPIGAGSSLESRLRDIFSGQYGVAYGHSFTFSDAMNTPGSRWVHRVKERLDFQWFMTYGYDGSTAQDLANYVIGGQGGQDNPRKYGGLKGLYVIQTGTIELITPDPNRGNIPLSTRQQKSVRENMNAILAAFEVSAANADRDDIRAAGGWTVTGTWAESSDITSNEQNQLFTTTFGDSVSKVIAVGGDYWVFLRGLQNEPSIYLGAAAEILVDGVVVETVDTANAGWDPGGMTTAEWGYIARKVTIPPGATLSIRKADSNGTYLILDFIAKELPATARPLVVFNRDVLGGPELQSTYHGIVDQVLADHPEVLDNDLSDGFDVATMIGSDLVHPNDLGQIHIANKLIETLSDNIEEIDPMNRVFGGPNYNVAVLVAHTYTGNRTVDMADLQAGWVRINSGSARTVTLPNNVPNGYKLKIGQWGAGTVTIAGTTLRSGKGLRTAFQYAIVEAEKIGTNEWLLTGDLMV